MAAEKGPAFGSAPGSLLLPHLRGLASAICRLFGNTDPAEFQLAEAAKVIRESSFFEVAAAAVAGQQEWACGACRTIQPAPVFNPTHPFRLVMCPEPSCGKEPLVPMASVVVSLVEAQRAELQGELIEAREALRIEREARLLAEGRQRASDEAAVRFAIKLAEERADRKMAEEAAAAEKAAPPT